MSLQSFKWMEVFISIPHDILKVGVVLEVSEVGLSA